MTIYQQPDSLSLSGNIKDIILTDATDKVVFRLSVGSTLILEHIYYPDEEHRIVIDIRRFVEEQLSFSLTYSTNPWEQPLLARSFSFTAGNLAAQTFTAIRTGIDHPGETAANWLRSNFLTWQPTVKHVTYSTPELLTYYAASACKVRIKVYYPNGTSGMLTAITLTAGVWTIPVSYAVIASRLGLTSQEALQQAEQLPGAYDVWIEDTSGNRLTYVQRYVAGNTRENEQWILFENSLGGVDCFRAYGQGSLETEHEHQLTDVDDETDEYRVDTVRRIRKSTGWMNMAERRWMLDFFPSRHRWICEDGVFRSIVLTEDSATYTLDNMPAEFEFTFRYTTNLAYLNVPRLLVPPSVLNITAPDLQSFSLPPRLAEFPRLDPSEGALIPVQSPYSDHWAAISIEDIISGSSADISRLERMINAEADARRLIQASLDDMFTKDTSTIPARIRANYSLYTNGHLLGMAGVAAGGITDPSSQGGGGGGGAAYTLSGDIPSANNLKLTLTSDDETLFPSSEVDVTAEGLVEFVKSGTALKLRVTDANVWGAVSGHLLGDGKILPAFLPDYLLGQVMYGGSAGTTGVCTLTQSFKDKYGVTTLTLTAQNASSYEGVYFIASADGTSGIPQSLGVLTGDWIISNGTAWTKIDNTDAVASVNGKTGVVVLDKGDVDLGNVENTKLSTWTGSTNLTLLGTIATGVWQGTPIADIYIASASIWNAKQDKIENVTDTPQDYKYVSAVSQTNGKIAVTHTDFPIATPEHIGMVSILAQSFAGDKSFTGFVHSDADVIGQTGVAAGGITDPTSQGGGVTNYNDLDDRPLINGAVLVGGESISLQPTISNLATIIENAVAGKIASDNLGGHTVAKDVPADAKFTDTVYDDAVLAGRVTAIETKDATYDAHLVDTNNPHAVTQAQVGLGNVDNTADADKNVLSATKLTTARTLWGVSFDGSANVTTAPNLYIGTTQVQASSVTQNLTGIGTLATSNKVTIGGGGLDVTGDIIAHNNIVLGDSTNNRSLYAYYLENDPIQMVGYNPDQGRIHFGYGAWAKEKAVTLEGNTIQFLSAAGTSHTMNFDASGNLGINVAAPQHRLDVGGDIFASAQIVGQTGVAAGGITDPTSSGGGGGGSVDAVKVNDVTYSPDASGVVTLPNYYNKTESDTKYATKTALQTTNIAVGALDTRLTTDEQNISGMSTDIYNLKGYFTNGSAKDALKLGGVTAATIENCIKSLQSQIDSVASRDSFDNLNASSLFADMMTAGVLHIDSGYIAGDAIATQSWVQDKHYVAKINGSYPDAEGYISVGGYFTDRFSSPTQDVYRLVLFGDDIELPFVNYTSSHSANDWGLWSKADVAQLDSAMTEIFSSLSGKADASDLVNYLLKTEAASTYVTTQRYEADLDDFMEKRRSAVAGNIAVWEGTESYGADGSVKDSGTSLSSIESGLQSLQSQIDSVSSRDSFDELTATSLFADTFTANNVSARQVSSNSVYLSNLDGKVTCEIIPDGAGVTIWGINPNVDRYSLFVGSYLLYDGNEVYHEGNLDFVLQSLQSQIDSVASRYRIDEALEDYKLSMETWAQNNFASASALDNCVKTTGNYTMQGSLNVRGTLYIDGHPLNKYLGAGSYIPPSGMQPGDYFVYTPAANTFTLLIYIGQAAGGQGWVGVDMRNS